MDPFKHIEENFVDDIRLAETFLLTWLLNKYPSHNYNNNKSFHSIRLCVIKIMKENQFKKYKYMLETFTKLVHTFPQFSEMSESTKEVYIKALHSVNEIFSVYLFLEKKYVVCTLLFEHDYQTIKVTMTDLWYLSTHPLVLIYPYTYNQNKILCSSVGTMLKLK